MHDEGLHCGCDVDGVSGWVLVVVGLVGWAALVDLLAGNSSDCYWSNVV